MPIDLQTSGGVAEVVILAAAARGCFAAFAAVYERAVPVIATVRADGGHGAV
jgi:hypothetical protein